MKRVLALLWLILFSATAFPFLIGGISNNPTAASGDVDAAAFLIATGITDPTISKAVSNFVVSLKGANSWGKFRAIYLEVGSTETTHKFNLKDPRDLDAAYRLTFSGSWTHASSGITPTATTDYADSHLVPSAVLDQNSNHWSYYLRGDSGSSANRWNMGAYGSTGFGLTTYNSSQLYFFANDGGFNPGGSVALVTNGLYVGSRTSSSTWGAFMPDQTKYARTDAPAANLSLSLYVSSLNLSGTGTNAPVGAECSFASFGDGLSDTEVAALYSAVAAFQTALGR